MVNADTPCDHGSTVRRTTAFLAGALLLAACSGGTARELSPYYDPQGYFRADLPTANEITVTPPQTGATGPGLLTGVIASPPQPSPSPSSAIGGGDMLAAQTQPQTDQTTYEAFALSTGSFSDLDEMALYFLGACALLSAIIAFLATRATNDPHTTIEPSGAKAR